jgi:UDP-galactose transporter B1
MIMGAFMGKKYPLKKYINVFLIVAGVGLFMGGGGSSSKKSSGDNDHSSSSSSSGSGQIIGILLLFISLCFDGGTGAYEDKLMAVHSVGPFDLMYNIQLGKTIIAGVSLLVLNQIHVFLQMCQEMGFVLVALGLTGALGQVFIFVTISKFGALTCSIIGLARKVTTLVASIYFYGHHLNAVQMSGLVISVASMVMNFMGKKKGGQGHGGHGSSGNSDDVSKHQSSQKIQIKHKDSVEGGAGASNIGIELKPINAVKPITAGGCS